MRSLALTLLSLVSTLLICIAADSGFLIPPNVGVENNFRDNPQYRIGEAINITWATDISVVDLILEIQLPNEADVPGESWDYVTLQRSLPETYYRWIVDLGSFPTAKKVLDEKGLVVLFFLVSRPGDGSSYHIRSHYFNITDPASMTTSMTMTSTSAPATSMPTPSPISTTTPPQDDSGSKKSSSGAVIGGAVGGSLGGLLIIGGLAYLVWRYLRKEKILLSKNEPKEHDFNSLATQQKVGGWGPSELHGSPSPVIHEAP
ncbi:hypothetical protein McanMca71_003335 [Microsporum canis]